MLGEALGEDVAGLPFARRHAQTYEAQRYIFVEAYQKNLATL
jgi:hypothetical protein